VPLSLSKDDKFPANRSNRSILFDPTGRWLAVDVGRGIQIFETRTGKLKSVIPVRSERNYLGGIPATRLRFKDENTLTTITPDNEIRTWDLRQGHSLLDVTESRAIAGSLK
jgi:WD40 repeat protein